MKRIIYFFFTIIIVACNPETESSEDPRVARIMSSIQPNLQIEGEEVIEQIVGDWDLEGVGTATLEFNEDHFTVTGSFLDDPVTLLPENDSTLFDKDDGTRVLLKKTNGVIDRMIANRTNGTKIKKE